MSKDAICPWCGSVMRLSRAHYYGGNDHAWFKCGVCGARSPDTKVTGCKFDYILGEWAEYPAEVEKAALKLWPGLPGILQPEQPKRVKPKRGVEQLELPCEMGSRVYIVVMQARRYTTAVFVKRSFLTPMNAYRVCKDFGRTVFLTGEEAEAVRNRIKAEIACEKGEA